MFLPNSYLFLITRKKIHKWSEKYVFTKFISFFAGKKKNVVFVSGGRRIVLPNPPPIVLVRKKIGKRKNIDSFSKLTSFFVGKKNKLARREKQIVLPSSPPVLLATPETVTPLILDEIQESAPDIPPPPSSDAPDSGQQTIRDKNKRTFLKAAGLAGVGLVASLFLPKKAEAFVMGSSPTTGVVGVKNAANARINPATEETLDEVLKTTDLTFDAGALQVKVTSVSGDGSGSFSDSGGVAKSALVDADRHVQVDVLSSTLPSSASTENTLQTISFGGYKFTLRLATVGEVDYVGEAAIGTATSAALWRIKKVDSTTGIIIQWAGTGVFNQVWDNRVSLSYS